jgi:SAM-dependent methyltransferase
MDSVETSAVGLPDIKKYWENASVSPIDQDALRSTARDPYLQQLVEVAIEKWIWPGALVLDLGCGDGISTLLFARRAGFVHGADFIPQYVDMARIRARRENVNNVEFTCCDIMNLGELRSVIRQADIAITIRCLINLANWQNQEIALREIAKMVRPGGLYMLSEGWSDGWEGLNRLRSRCGLDPIELVKYNCLINRNRFEESVRNDFDILHYENLGFYIFMSRVFQPAYVAPMSPKHQHDINRIAAQLGCFGIGSNEFRDCDYAGVYILRRKS